jgi:hypothetical protein
MSKKPALQIFINALNRFGSVEPNRSNLSPAVLSLPAAQSSLFISCIPFLHCFYYTSCILISLALLFSSHAFLIRLISFIFFLMLFYFIFCITFYCLLLSYAYLNFVIKYTPQIQSTLVHFSSHAFLFYFRITFYYLLLSYAYLNFVIKYINQSRVLWSILFSHSFLFYFRITFY